MHGIAWMAVAGEAFRAEVLATDERLNALHAALWCKVFSAVHWSVALQTGLATGVLAVLLSFTPVGRLFGNRFGNALMVGCLTALGDAYTHPGGFGSWYSEALLTGWVSGLLALAGSYLVEDCARRL